MKKLMYRPYLLRRALVLLLANLILGTLPVTAQSQQTDPSKNKSAISNATIASGPIPHEFVREIFDKICAAGIKHPKIVIRQAILETGWFRSPFLMTRNNIFGFKTQKYLQFANIDESIQYYRQWQDRNYRSTYNDYYNFLTDIKYGSPGYSEHVRKIRWDKDCP